MEKVMKKTVKIELIYDEENETSCGNMLDIIKREISEGFTSGTNYNEDGAFYGYKATEYIDEDE